MLGLLLQRLQILGLLLQRLQTADEEIIEVLLSKQRLVTALHFVKSTGRVEQVSARKFLEAAKNCRNDDTFYSVFKFFEQRNQRLRGTAAFAPGMSSPSAAQPAPTWNSGLRSRYEFPVSSDNQRLRGAAAFAPGMSHGLQCNQRLCGGITAFAHDSLRTVVQSLTLLKHTQSVGMKLALYARPYDVLAFHLICGKYLSIDCLLSGEHCDVYVKHLESILRQQQDTS